MKAIISSTNDPLYSFFIPIATWCWNKLGVDVILFMPEPKEKARFVGFKDSLGSDDLDLELGPINAVYWALNDQNMRYRIERFECPEHKEVTYAQCSRLYSSSVIQDKGEFLITGDVDMATFKLPPLNTEFFTIWGVDLVPTSQYPICYISATKDNWDKHVTKGRSHQTALDDLLGSIECENFRGNYWGKDQETIYNSLNYASVDTFPRARPGTHFASNRVDRDDMNWRSYLDSDLVDAHLWRPGYTDENFANIMELLTTQYPNENFQWLINYRNEYIKLL